MIFTRWTLFTPVAACWMIYFAFDGPLRVGSFDIPWLSIPVHLCCTALILLWLTCACIHWFIVVARLRL